jgi:2-C-methyl-D-erythritol 2,4-cyclodiphosphate synthase
MLRRVLALVEQGGWRLANLDCTLIAEAPRMSPHIPGMRDNLTADLKVALGCINVKATTTEQLGFTGRGEGIAAHAMVLLEAQE